MTRLKDIKENKEEMKFFSQLVHSYFKLAMMRVMQQLRQRWDLNPQEVQEILFSIIGRMVNECAYGLHGAMSGSKMRVEEILPPMTIQILKEALLHGNVINPQERKDINIDIKEFNEFLSNINKNNDL